jgi:hypothetical protein
MARHVLGGPRDDGRSSYQLVLSVCGACGSGAQKAAGELVPIDAAVVGMAACDGQHLPEFRAANENASANEEAEAHDTRAGLSAAESTRARQTSDHAHVDAQSRRASDAAANPSDATGTTPPTRTRRAETHPRCLV